jgi:hypothetical protein
LLLLFAMIILTVCGCFSLQAGAKAGDSAFKSAQGRRIAGTRQYLATP